MIGMAKLTRNRFLDNKHFANYFPLLVSCKSAEVLKRASALLQLGMIGDVW